MLKKVNFTLHSRYFERCRGTVDGTYIFQNQAHVVQTRTEDTETNTLAFSPLTFFLILPFLTDSYFHIQIFQIHIFSGADSRCSQRILPFPCLAAAVLQE